MTKEMVNSVMIQGEEVALQESMTAEDAQAYLNDMGFGGEVQGTTPRVQDGVMTFEQVNAEKGG